MSDQASITSFLVKRSREDALPNTRSIGEASRKRAKWNSICEAKSTYEKARVNRRIALLKQFDWLEVERDSEDSKKYFKCKFCDIAIVAKRKAEVGRHAACERHISRRISTQNVHTIQATSVTDWELLTSRFLTKCMAYRIPLYMVEKLYDPTMCALAQAVCNRVKSQRSLTIYSRRAADLIIECLKHHFRGKIMTLIADEASIPLQGGKYLLAIAAVSWTDKTPLLIDVVTSSIPFNSDSIQAYLNHSMDRLGIDCQSVAGFMADNCSVMGATARKANFTKFGCVAHTLSLMCNALIDTLHPVSSCIAAVHSWLFSSDSIQRRMKFKTYMHAQGCKSVTLNAFSVCRTRWGTYMHTASMLHKYRAQVQAFAQSQLFDGPNATARSIISYLQDKMCIAGLHALNYFAIDMCEAITIAESDNPNKLQLLRIWDELLDVVGNDWITTQNEVEVADHAEDALQPERPPSSQHVYDLKFDSRFKNAVKTASGMHEADYTRFRSVLRKACRLVVQKSKHAEATIEALRHASIFDPVAGGGGSVHCLHKAAEYLASLSQSSTLCCNVDLNSTVYRQFETLQEHFVELQNNAKAQIQSGASTDLPQSEVERQVNGALPTMTEFWSESGNQGKYSQLLPFAQVLAAIPSSSAHAERMFSLCRQHLTDQRLLLAVDTFETEIFVSANQNLLQKYAENESLIRDITQGVSVRVERKSTASVTSSSTESVGDQ